MGSLNILKVTDLHLWELHSPDTVSYASSDDRNLRFYATLRNSFVSSSNLILLLSAKIPR